MSGLLVEVQGLKIHFHTDEGIVRAVDGVDLPIYRGRTLCVVGESGCGKSVMALSLLHIIHDPGRIVEGKILYHRAVRSNGPSEMSETLDVATLRPQGREIRQVRGAEIAMIFQEPMTSLSPMYTVGNQIVEAIRLHSRASQQRARERAVELLGYVGIPKPERLVDEYPFRLSGGMRQRAMIAMALSCSPSLLIADEPTTALDVTTQAQILDLMQTLQREQGMGVLFITHDLGVVAEIAHDVAVMYLGNVVEYGDVDTIFNRPQHPYTQALLRSIPKVSATRQTLEVIEGMVPSPYRRPSGCPFHPRCARVRPECSTRFPGVTALGSKHLVRCLLYSQGPKQAAAGEAGNG